MINELQKIFHSITKSLEVQFVLEGIKPCSRILVFEDELKKVTDYLNQKKIIFLVSDFKVLKQNLQSEFYSDRSIKISKDDARKGHFFVYLSKSSENALKAKAAEEKNDHLELGLLLGYPECCCEFFTGHFSENNADLTLNALQNSDGYEFSFYNNIAARHFDISLLSHFPHSFGCEPSIKIAKNNFEIIKKHSVQLGEMFAGILKGVVIYTKNEGIFLLRNHKGAGDETIYDEVLTTSKSKLYFLLNSNKMVKIIDKNNFIAGDVNIGGDDYGIMVFC